MSFLGLENLHVFITGASGGIGSEAVKEFVSKCVISATHNISGHLWLSRSTVDEGCKVTAHDCRKSPFIDSSSLYIVEGDISDESSIQSCMQKARNRFGPINILIANAGITDERHEYPIWETSLELWERTYKVNVRGTFLTVKHFLRSAKLSQEEKGSELENLAIVVTGSETGKFGQAGHTEYASGKAGLQYGFVRGVKNEIVRLNQRARINAVAPGWVDTALIGNRLHDPKELWAESQATVSLKKVAKPEDVARAMAFLASHRAAGHISGECLSIDGGMEGRVIWKEAEIVTPKAGEKTEADLPVAR
ncbi:MAG: hypothetical protein Q9214_003950 [Letrouitia sp. 1 TL-2023]